MSEQRITTTTTTMPTGAAAKPEKDDDKDPRVASAVRHRPIPVRCECGD